MHLTRFSDDYVHSFTSKIFPVSSQLVEVIIISLDSAVLSGMNKQSLEVSMRKMTSSKLNLSLYRFFMMRMRCANQTDLKIKGENVCCFYKEILLFGMSQQNQDFIICEFVFIDYKICQRHNRPEG